MKLYKRVCSVNIGGRELSYPPLTMDFEIEFGGNATGKVKIFNPADETVSACEKKGNDYPKVVISAGYAENYGTCFVGEVIKHEYGINVDGVLEITVGDASSYWLNSLVNKSWSGSVSAKSVIQDILQAIGITSAKLEFGVEFNYSNGVSFSGSSLQAALTKLAKDTKSQFFFRNGQAVFLAPVAGYDKAYLLSPETGLLKYQKTERGYKIDSLFLYQIGSGSLIQLQTGKIDNLNLRVTKGKHYFSATNEAKSQMEVIRID